MKRIGVLLPIIAFIFAPAISQAQTTSSSNNSGAAIENTLGIGPRAGY